MTIPPISGQNIPPQTGTTAGKTEASAKPGKEEETRVPEPARSDTADISEQARNVRDLQADITRLQVIEKSLKEIEKDTSETLGNLADTQKTRDAQTAQSAETQAKRKDQAEQYIKKVQAHSAMIESECERLATERAARAKTILRDVHKEVEFQVREVKDAVSREGHTPAAKLPQEASRLAGEVARVYAGLQNDVREIIAGAVKESSRPNPKDIQDAENLLNDARRARDQSAENSASADQIANRVVNLLQ